MNAASDKPAKWDKDRVVAALLDRQARGNALNSFALRKSEPRLWNAVCSAFGSHDAALRAAGIKPQSVRLRDRWNRSKIVAALRKRQAKGLPLHSSSLRKSHGGLLSAIYLHFTSHEAALRAAGIDPESARRPLLWDKARIVELLRERHARGEPMNFAAIAAWDSRLIDAIRKHVGSVAEALRAAGLDPASVRKQIRWDKAMIVQALRERQARGQPINSAAVQASDHRLANAIQNHIGSHDAALRAAGIEPPAFPKRPYWDQACITAALRERQEKGLPLNIRAIADSDSKLANAIARHFNSHDDALRSIGVDPDSVRKQRRGWSEEEVLAILRGLARNGVLSTPLANTVIDAARHRFGSVQAAAQAAGLRYQRRGGKGIGHWTEKLVLQALRDLHRDGHDLRYRFMKEHSQPLFFAAKEFFGSYVNAVRQAGIDYWQMSQANLARERAAAARDAGNAAVCQEMA